MNPAGIERESRHFMVPVVLDMSRLLLQVPSRLIYVSVRSGRKGFADALGGKTVISRWLHVQVSGDICDVERIAWGKASYLQVKPMSCSESQL